MPKGPQKWTKAEEKSQREMGFEDEGRGREPKNAGSVYKLEKATK